MNTLTPDHSNSPFEGRTTRRGFLETIGKLSFIAAFAGILASTARFLLPNVLYEPPTVFVIGNIDDFPPDSVTFLEEKRLFLFRRPEGIYAVSSICTHLGCNVKWNGGREGFDCPCHGSTYDQNGKNISGPAPKPLKWYEMALTSDGKVQINTQRLVDKNFRLRV